jgi:hypothetical protein
VANPIFIHKELLQDDLVGAWCGVLQEQLGLLDLIFLKGHKYTVITCILTPSLCPFQQGSKQLTDHTLSWDITQLWESITC